MPALLGLCLSHRQQQHLLPLNSDGVRPGEGGGGRGREREERRERGEEREGRGKGGRGGQGGREKVKEGR